MIHPGFSVPFPQLILGLKEEVEQGNINTRTNDDLTQWTYTQQCTYEAKWNLYTTVARGLITNDERIVAVPFPKFFNLTENKTIIPNLPFTCYEKVDGSLIIAYFYEGEWRTATKGSFNSDQAIWAKKYIDKNWMKHILFPGYTYLFEAVYPENKIVINYTREDLILLAVYDNHYGLEMNDAWIKEYVKSPPPFSIRKTYSFADLNSIVEKCSTLSSNEEGFVLRYEDGTRVKIKGDEYCRVHRLISNITPLAIWEMMMKGDDLEFIRKELPEEFLVDFDNIVDIIGEHVTETRDLVRIEYLQTKHLSDKELGLMLPSLSDDVRKFIFPYRKNNGQFIGKMREGIFRMHRPTSNRLEGYFPSSSMNRINEDE